MQRYIALVVIFLAASILLAACSKNQTVPDIVIQFKDGAYNPNNVTIKVGQTITFSNIGGDLIWPASNIHPTHQIYPEFDPRKSIKAGDSWGFTFTRPGIWKYHDHLQPQISGEIIVE